MKNKKINNKFFNGIIDEVRIYNRALSAEEIKLSYNKNMKNKKSHQENWEKKARKLLAELTTILIETGSAERIIAKRDEVMDFIRQLLSQQKQDIIENMKITQFDVDDVMNQWTDYDWVDAWKDDIEIADLINAKIKSKLNNLYQKNKIKKL